MFLDTSGLLCYMNKKEPQHQQARQILNNTKEKLLTHSQVLSELVALAFVRRFSRTAALDFVTQIVDDPEIETVWIDEGIHREAMHLLGVRQDKAYSLCDAISFILMRRVGITDALTTDRHFEQEGFVRLLPPII